MADDSLSGLMDSIRTRFQAELDSQLGRLTEQHKAELAEHEAELARAREEAATEAERRWSAVLDSQIASSRQALEAAVATARDEATRQAAITPIQPEPGTLLDAFQMIDRARSVSDALSAIARAAGAGCTGAVLLVANGSQLDAWNGHSDATGYTRRPDSEVMAAAMDAFRLATVRRNGSSVAAPLLLDGQAVGVICAMPGAAARLDWADTIEMVARYGAAQLAALTALKTAQAREWISRDPRGRPTAPVPPASQPDKVRAQAPSSKVPVPAHPPDNDHRDDQALRGPSDASEEAAQSARRYARLLVSEIKLYNEAAVREGRERRDILRRLGPEVERARRLYEERVPSTVSGRAHHFHQELVQTLASGDPSLLG